jgi:hypothetical protein
MNWKLLTVFAIAAGSIFFMPTAAPAKSEVKFICGQSFDQVSGQRYPTTYAWNHRGKMAIIRWKKQWGSTNYRPQQRCEEVSSRFQQAYNKGTLNFITNGVMNGQPVICTTSGYGRACESLLVTLQQGENSLAILDELKGVLFGQITEPLSRSPRNSQRYYQINIDQFLETATVEEESSSN